MRAGHGGLLGRLLRAVLAGSRCVRIVFAVIGDALLRGKEIEATEALAQSSDAKVGGIGAGKEGLPLILGGAG